MQQELFGRINFEGKRNARRVKVLVKKARGLLILAGSYMILARAKSQSNEWYSVERTLVRGNPSFVWYDS